LTAVQKRKEYLPDMKNYGKKAFSQCPFYFAGIAGVEEPSAG
jgi:hypothetical protein